MARLVGSAGSFARSYSARASGSVGTDAHATRNRIDTTAVPRASIAAAADNAPDFEALALIRIVPFRRDRHGAWLEKQNPAVVIGRSPTKGRTPRRRGSRGFQVAGPSMLLLSAPAGVRGFPSGRAAAGSRPCSFGAALSVRGTSRARRRRS